MYCQFWMSNYKADGQKYFSATHIQCKGGLTSKVVAYHSQLHCLLCDINNNTCMEDLRRIQRRNICRTVSQTIRGHAADRNQFPNQLHHLIRSHFTWVTVTVSSGLAIGWLLDYLQLQVNAMRTTLHLQPSLRCMDALTSNNQLDTHVVALKCESSIWKIRIGNTITV